MRMYIWNQPYDVQWGASFAFAVADSEQEARELILASNGRVMNYGAYEAARPNFKRLNAAPDRILDLPCAEIYEWSE
jgi:hypothetical protein